SPLVSPANTVIVPVKTGAFDGFKVEARSSRDGALIWSSLTDYVSPQHSWLPSYSPALDLNNRLYFPGAGATVLYRDSVDSAGPLAIGRIAFSGSSAYTANSAGFTSTVFVNTPITVDSAGTIYFGFRTNGTLPAEAPSGLRSGIARIDANGNGSWVSA